MIPMQESYRDKHSTKGAVTTPKKTEKTVDNRSFVLEDI